MKPVISSDLSREHWRLKITSEALSASPFQSRLAAVKTGRQQLCTPEPSVLSPSHPHNLTSTCDFPSFPGPAGSVGFILYVKKHLGLRNLLSLLHILHFHTPIPEWGWSIWQQIISPGITPGFRLLFAPHCYLMLSDDHFRSEISHRTPQNKLFRRKSRKPQGWLHNMTQTTGKCKGHADSVSFSVLQIQSPKFWV